MTEVHVFKKKRFQKTFFLTPNPIRSAGSRADERDARTIPRARRPRTSCDELVARVGGCTETHIGASSHMSAVRVRSPPEEPETIKRPTMTRSHAKCKRTINNKTIVPGSPRRGVVHASNGCLKGVRGAQVKSYILRSIKALG